MSTITTTATKSDKAVKPTITEFIPTINPTRKLYTRGPQHKYGDFRDDLIRDGFAVIKGAIPHEKALNYVDQLYGFLENLYGLSLFQNNRLIHPNTLTDIKIQRTRLRSQQAGDYPRKAPSDYQ